MKEDRIQSWLTAVTAVFMVVFCLSPFIYMVAVSLSKRPDFLSSQVPFIFTAENYRDVLSDPSLHFLRFLGNSLFVSGVSAFFVVIIASLAAYAITRLNLPGKGTVLFLILAVSLFPQISVVGYLFKFMTSMGWINTYQALILPYIAWILPLSVWILVSYFSQIPRELDEAATVDGCTSRQVLARVVFPVAAPGIFSVLLLSFIFAFNEFMFALMFTIDYKARTIPVGIALFEGLYGQVPWPAIMAASVIAILPVIVLTIIFQRRIIGGLTRGAVKG